MTNNFKLLINLHNKPNRLIHSINQLRKVDFTNNIVRIEACTEEKAKLEMHKYLSRKAYNNISNIQSTTIIPNYRALACAISHINCWKLIQSNFSEGFIIEDDLEISNPDLFKLDMYYIKKIIKKHNKSNKALLITFNSKSIMVEEDYYDDQTIYNLFYDVYNENNYYRNINKTFCHNISGPIYGTHFYYINYEMATLLLHNINELTYQIDIEIGLIAKKKSSYGCNIFININMEYIKQSKKFKSDIQLYRITLCEISSLLNIPEDIARIIYDFIPKCLKNIEDKNQLPLILNNNKNIDLSSLIYELNYSV